MTKEEAQKQGIAESWPLVDFIKAHGKMSVVPFVRQETGEAFKSCKFAGKGEVGMCFASFAEKLGELTPAEIVARRNELQINKMKVSGKYVLSKKGSFEGEEVVDIPID